jgi:hypothetical protein
VCEVGGGVLDAYRQAMKQQRNSTNFKISTTSYGFFALPAGAPLPLAAALLLLLLPWLS